ncbi:MAG: hypothetical protein QOJ16_1905 [Acidobacteriota bacterium]|jgi:hypothetical protein|nr:hypothetical protein [Acidobacteriota bacterium]
MIKKSHDILMLLVLPAAILATGCVHGTSKPQTEPQELRVEGEISTGQFGCLQVKTADGQRYTLARDLEGSKPGQRVWIEGYVVKTKGCMPGVSLMPRHAGLMDAATVAEAVPVAGSSGH